MRPQFAQPGHLFYESILHSLVDNATLSAPEAVTVIEVSKEVKAELAASTGDPER